MTKEQRANVEKFMAIAELCNEVIPVLQELYGEVPAEAEKPAKKDKKAPKVEEKAEEAVEPDEVKTAADIIEVYGLNDASEGDIKDSLTEAGIKFPPKAKKSALIDLFVKGVQDGTIADGEATETGESEDAKEAAEEGGEDGAEEGEGYTEEEIREMSMDELTTLCEENDIEIPESITSIKVKAKKKEALADFVVEQVVETAEEATEATAESGDDDFEASEARLEAEAKIEKAIRAKIKTKKLTVAAMKKDLTDLYDGVAECKGCKKCSEDELIDCYINWKKAFVDDDGDTHEDGDPYNRNELAFCCGQPTKQDPDNEDQVICEVCGEVHPVG